MVGGACKGQLGPGRRYRTVWTRLIHGFRDSLICFGFCYDPGTGAQVESVPEGK